MEQPMAMPGQVMAQPMVMQQPAMIQAQPVIHQPQHQMMNVQIPEGVAPGQQFQVSCNGQLISVQCPPGSYPGSTVQIQAPVRNPMIQGGGAPAPHWYPGAAPGGDKACLCSSLIRFSEMYGWYAGYYETENYCGIITILIAIFVVPCVCCCPCDSRQVCVDPQGMRFPNDKGGC